MAWQSADSERILFAAGTVVVQALLILVIWVRRRRISAAVARWRVGAGRGSWP
jgi:hypothetical protein